MSVHNDLVDPTEISDEVMEHIVQRMAGDAAAWTTEQFASRTVGLLIHDQGNLNKYQRTLELVFRVHAAVVSNRASSETDQS